jgi:hypothetical protein
MFTMATSVGNHETSDVSTALDSFMCTVLLYNDEFASVHQYAPAKPIAPDTLAGRTNRTRTQDAKSLTGSCPAPVWLGLLVEVSRLHSVTHARSVGPLWTSDQPIAETSTWQCTTLTTDRYPCPWWDSNPQFQQESFHDNQLIKYFMSSTFFRSLTLYEVMGWSPHTNPPSKGSCCLA